MEVYLRDDYTFYVHFFGPHECFGAYKDVLFPELDSLSFDDTPYSAISKYWENEDDGDDDEDEILLWKYPEEEKTIKEDDVVYGEKFIYRLPRIETEPEDENNIIGPYETEDNDW